MSGDVVRLPDHVMHKAYDNWCLAIGKQRLNTRECANTFWVYLGGLQAPHGLERDNQSNEWYYYLTSEEVSRAEQLLGPHFRTIVKAWYSKHDIPWDREW